MIQKLVLFLVLLNCIGLFADGTPPAGSGTEAVPFQIENLDNLLWISTTSTSWDKFFIQTENIDAAATQYWNTNTGFGSIGYDVWNYFTGTYDGQNNTIDNLYIDRVNDNAMGMFGYLEKSASIKNLGLTNVNITGNDNVGALVGFADDDSTISNCYSTGAVSGHNNVGSLVGYNYWSTISECYSTGSVTGDGPIGGLVVNSHNAGGSVINSFWDIETSGLSWSDGGTGKTTAEMKTQSTFLNQFCVLSCIVIF